jgi:two-component system, chemotaxis family, protein-glutamate methylesterase/glutaminase
MPAIRILVVDDSTVIRKVLSDSLSIDPEIEVAATAANGQIALSKIPGVNPDLVTLDIEMPVMNGLETLAQIRRLYPTLPVIMFSTLTERGASATLEALSLGASDYVTKPSNTGSLGEAADRVRAELLPKIKALCGRKRTVQAKPRAFPTSAPPIHRNAIRSRIEVLAIGTSTGGPNALSVLMPSIPGDFPVPVVIVQHMPPIFTRLLAERLSASSRIRVREAREGAPLEAGTAWIAPGNYHMVVQRKGTAPLHRTEPRSSRELVPSGRGRLVPIRRPHVRSANSRRGDDWNGFGRADRVPRDTRGGQRSDRSG